MNDHKIRQPKLSDLIEQRLEELILEGSLQPGAKLPSERALAKHFNVSRPSLREAIQRLETRGLLLCRQGGGTFVQARLWQSFSDPLTELLTEKNEAQFDLLETRHALEGIAAYYAALRGSDGDLKQIANHYHRINQYEINEVIQQNIDAHTEAVLQYHLAITEASHNLVLLHLSRCMIPMLRSNIKQNLGLLYQRQELLEQVNQHRTTIFTTIMAREPEQAWAASHRHLAFIEEMMLVLNREQSRQERSLRRLQFQKL